MFIKMNKWQRFSSWEEISMIKHNNSQIENNSHASIASSVVTNLWIRCNIKCTPWIWESSSGLILRIKRRMEKYRINQDRSRRWKSFGHLPWISGSWEVTHGKGEGRIYSIFLVSSSSDASFSSYSYKLLRELAHSWDEIQLIYLQISIY